MRPISERLHPVKSAAVRFNMGILHTEAVTAAKGEVFIDLIDGKTGKVLEHRHIDNIIVLDAGILIAMLLKGDAPNGLTMLGVGTGATGALLAPDVPQIGQRKLNIEIQRKPFTSTQYRNSSGAAVAIPTNIVDYVTIFSESEAVGALNEMALMATASPNPDPAFWEHINNGPTNYDPTIDVTGKDLLLNYLTFGVLTKPNTATLQITWRITT